MKFRFVYDAPPPDDASYALGYMWREETPAAEERRLETASMCYGEAIKFDRRHSEMTRERVHLTGFGQADTLYRASRLVLDVANWVHIAVYDAPSARNTPQVWPHMVGADGPPLAPGVRLSIRGQA